MLGRLQGGRRSVYYVGSQAAALCEEAHSALICTTPTRAPLLSFSLKGAIKQTRKERELGQWWTRGKAPSTRNELLCLCLLAFLPCYPALYMWLVSIKYLFTEWINIQGCNGLDYSYFRNWVIGNNGTISIWPFIFIYLFFGGGGHLWSCCFLMISCHKTV